MDVTEDDILFGLNIAFNGEMFDFFPNDCKSNAKFVVFEQS